MTLVLARPELGNSACDASSLWPQEKQDCFLRALTPRVRDYRVYRAFMGSRFRVLGLKGLGLKA